MDISDTFILILRDVCLVVGGLTICNFLLLVIIGCIGVRVQRRRMRKPYEHPRFTDMTPRHVRIQQERRDTARWN